MKKITLKFLEFSRLKKQLVIASFDVVILILSLWAAFSLRLDKLYQPSEQIAWLFVVVPLIAIPVFVRFGLYRAIIRYIGFRALWAVMQAVSLYSVLWSLVVLLSGISGVPRSVPLINWLIALLLIGGSRMMARWWFTGNFSGILSSDKSNRINVVIYGAGYAGVQLASVLSYSKEYKPIAFIDDDSDLHHQQINTLKVYSPKKLDRLITEYKVNEVLLALPSATHARRNEIIQLLEPYPVHVRTLPGMSEIANGQVKLEDIKEIDIEDLLGRDARIPDTKLLTANIAGKVVMVTGAGGSIGSELCRQILLQNPKQLILFEQHEYALYTIDKELKKLCQASEEPPCDDKLISILGSVTDLSRLEHVCFTFCVDTIFHAAAYKHVPMVEKNPIEAIQNNIFGTYYSAQAAMNANVETFVLISTDKAVRPTNVMGASKRFAELVLQALAKEESSTRFCMVRFGNVLGSSGSVVPLFREQVQHGGPITVTHPDIIRYFMTIPEAAQLVIQAGSLGKGGDVFVLDMGEPVKILDLARKMVHLMGFEIRDKSTPDGDISIEYTGLRPGEKLYEELLIGDNASGTSHPQILRAEEEFYSWPELQSYLSILKEAIVEADCEKMRDVLLQVISGYNPQGDIEDYIWQKTNINKVKGTVISLK